MYLFFILLSLLTFRISTEGSVNLSPNILINPNLTVPLNSGSSYSFINKSITGWNCTNVCEIDVCFYLNRNNVRANFTFADCIGQVIDLNSIQFHETVSQLIQLKAGIYRLGFNYYLPYKNANLKIFHVQVNQLQVFTIRPVVSFQFMTNIIEIDVSLGEGITNISFFDTGYVTDSIGYKINNVSLRRYYNPIVEQLIDNSMNNTFLNYICLVPGYRVIFGQLMNYFVNLDRLLLYSYSNRTYSFNWELFLNAIYNLEQLQDQFFQEYLGSAVTQAQQWIQDLNYKQGDDFQSQTLQQKININSFLQANNTFFGCSMPLFCMQVLFLYVLFRLFFNYSISLFLRSFFFVLPTILLMVTEGNVEQITFFMFGQILTLFTANYTHKIVNVFLIFFFFLIVFLIFSIDLWFLYSFKKNWKFLIDGYPSIFWGSLGRFIDKGLFCMLLGITHRLLMNNNYQLIVISIWQIAWIAFRCSLLLKAYKQKMIAVLDILSGVTRICFILSISLYQISPSAIQILLNQQCDVILIFLILAISISYFTITLMNIFRAIRKIIKKISKNGDSNKKTKINSKSKEIRKQSINKMLIKQQFYQVKINLNYPAKQVQNNCKIIPTKLKMVNFTNNTPFKPLQCKQHHHIKIK